MCGEENAKTTVTWSSLFRGVKRLLRRVCRVNVPRVCLTLNGNIKTRVDVRRTGAAYTTDDAAVAPLPTVRFYECATRRRGRAYASTERKRFNRFSGCIRKHKNTCGPIDRNGRKQREYPYGRKNRIRYVPPETAL